MRDPRPGAGGPPASPAPSQRRPPPPPGSRETAPQRLGASSLAAKPGFFSLMLAPRCHPHYKAGGPHCRGKSCPREREGPAPCFAQRGLRARKSAPPPYSFCLFSSFLQFENRERGVSVPSSGGGACLAFRPWMRHWDLLKGTAEPEDVRPAPGCRAAERPWACALCQPWCPGSPGTARWGPGT